MTGVAVIPPMPEQLDLKYTCTVGLWPLKYRELHNNIRELPFIEGH
jgi:hypothetical protein